MNTYLLTEEWRETRPIVAAELCTKVLVEDPAELKKRSKRHRDIRRSHRLQAGMSAKERCTTVSAKDPRDEAQRASMETHADHPCPLLKERGASSATTSVHLSNREVLRTRFPQEIISSPETQRL